MLTDTRSLICNRQPANGTSWRWIVCCCALVGLFFGSLAGCAQWSKDTTTEAKPLLAQPKMSPDSVVVETVIIRFPNEQSEALDNLWSTVDESVFDVELRRKLAENGMRGGVLIGELPLGVRARMEQLTNISRNDPLEQANLAADVKSTTNRMQCRAGRRKEVHVRREVSQPIVVLTSEEGRVEGANYDQPALLFDLRSIPHGDGQATLRLTPEIQHGEERKAFVRSDFGLRPEMSRARKTWEDLAMSVKLRPGQIIALSCNGEPRSSNLGKAFFVTRTAEQTDERVLLLIKLAETQLDELFAPEGVAAAQVVAER
jgi:hypothetical protein